MLVEWVSWERYLIKTNEKKGESANAHSRCSHNGHVVVSFKYHLRQFPDSGHGPLFFGVSVDRIETCLRRLHGTSFCSRLVFISYQRTQQMPHQPRNRSPEPTPDWRAAGRRPALARGCCWAPSTPSLPAGIWPLRKKSPILFRKKNSFRFFFVAPHFLPRSVGTQCGGSTYVAGAVAFTRGVHYSLSEAAAHLRSPIIVRLHGAAADQPALRYPDAHPT